MKHILIIIVILFSSCHNINVVENINTKDRFKRTDYTNTYKEGDTIFDKFEIRGVVYYDTLIVLKK